LLAVRRRSRSVADGLVTTGPAGSSHQSRARKIVAPVQLSSRRCDRSSTLVTRPRSARLKTLRIAPSSGARNESRAANCQGRPAVFGRSEKAGFRPSRCGRTVDLRQRHPPAPPTVVHHRRESVPLADSESSTRRFAEKRLASETARVRSRCAIPRHARRTAKRGLGLRGRSEMVGSTGFARHPPAGGPCHAIPSADDRQPAPKTR